MQRPIPFSLRNGYRPFTWHWCREICTYPYDLCRDLYTVYHRARYGWAPRDVWNLDGYLDRVLADTLVHLAKTTHGTPSGYPYKKHPPLDEQGCPVTDHAQWTQDLLRWAAVFEECCNADDMDDLVPPTVGWQGWQQRESRRDRRARVLAEMSYWWDGLWD